MIAPMTFQTASDILNCILDISALLGSCAVKIFDQAHDTTKFLFGICIVIIKVSLIVRIYHDVKMR